MTKKENEKKIAATTMGHERRGTKQHFKETGPEKRRVISLEKKVEGR